MNFTSDVLPWITQGIMGAVLLYLALRKAPAERQTLDATTAAQYAQAAKLKGEENAKLEDEITDLQKRLELVERKKYRVILDFTIGDPPELGKVTIEPLVDIPPEMIDRNTHLKQKPKGKQT